MPEYVGQSYGQTVTCRACGSRVDAAATEAHDAWHAQLDVLLPEPVTELPAVDVTTPLPPAPLPPDTPAPPQPRNHRPQPD